MQGNWFTGSCSEIPGISVHRQLFGDPWDLRSPAVVRRSLGSLFTGSCSEILGIPKQLPESPPAVIWRWRWLEIISIRYVRSWRSSRPPTLAVGDHLDRPTSLPDIMSTAYPHCQRSSRSGSVVAGDVLPCVPLPVLRLQCRRVGPRSSSPPSSAICFVAVPLLRVSKDFTYRGVSRERIAFGKAVATVLYNCAALWLLMLCLRLSCHCSGCCCGCGCIYRGCGLGCCGSGCPDCGSASLAKGVDAVALVVDVAVAVAARSTATRSVAARFLAVSAAVAIVIVWLLLQLWMWLLSLWLLPPRLWLYCCGCVCAHCCGCGCSCGCGCALAKDKQVFMKSLQCQTVVQFFVKWPLSD